MKSRNLRAFDIADDAESYERRIDVGGSVGMGQRQDYSSIQRLDKG